jgi:acyl dehydratase
MLDLEGATYGPFPYRTDPEKVGEYAVAVGAVPSESSAPKSLAGALLFVVAPHLLGDDRAGDSTRSVIHGDQGFAWHRPIPLGTDLAVSGKVTRVRERSGVFLTGFRMEAADAKGLVVEGTSTFLMSGSGAAPAAGGRERTEPDPLDGSVREVRGPLTEAPSVVGHFSASRADLVRYAGASRDWNPIHWDHAAAVAAGLPGVVVHGLLQSAWALEAAVQLGLDPVAARFRYKRPLGAGVKVAMSASLAGDEAVFELGDSEGLYLTGTLE